MTELTELEQAALGVVGREGPCSPYRVRKAFLASPTPSWSGSAGTIYPLMRRLEELGLLVSREVDGDGRATLHYRLTASGRRAVKRWLRPPLPAAAVGPGPDPIRTRLQFLGALSDAERREFLEVVGRQLEQSVEELQSLKRSLEKEGDALQVLALRGGLRVARARRDWFREVRAELG